MGSVINAGTSMPAPVVSDMFNAVRGHSALAKIADRTPIAFSGATEFVFNMDHEASIVAESGAKVNGGATATPVVIRPVKFEYGTRVSAEFMYASEENRMNIMRDFAEAAGRKFAKGFDIAALHGLNPYSLTASAVVGNNHFDYAIPGGSVITYVSGSEDANLEAAIAAVGSQGYECNGVAFDPVFSSALAQKSVGNVAIAPDMMFGGNPDTFHGMRSDVNKTVDTKAAGADAKYLYVGDFNAFRWGYASDVMFDVIEYGDPDNAGSDLKGHNQVYLRCEAYIGWGILDGNAFAKVEA